MSAELVGFENLPNVFIKEVSVYDFSETEIELKISLRLHDLKDNPVWYNTSEFLTQLLQVGVIVLENLEDMEKLNSGNAFPQDFDITTKAVPKPQIDEENYIFDISLTKIIKKSVNNLNIYSFCFIDKVKALEHIGISLDQNYYSPIKSEKVLQNGLIPSNTFVFKKNNGDYWSGPVHQANDGSYMMGSYHTEGQTETLNRLIIKNTKIKDHRKDNRATQIQSLEINNIVSDLSVSYNSNTDVNAVFMINIKSLLKKKTNYGRFLERASSQIITQILNDFKISLMTIQRHRIRTINQSTRLRSKKQAVEKIINKKAILKSHDEQGVLKNYTRLERNGIYDIVETELRSNLPDNIRGKGEIFKEELGDYKKIAKITELFMSYGQEIRTFQFNDYELTDKTAGKYRYSLSLQFIDPFEKLLNQISASMKFDLSEIKKYVNLSARKRDLTTSNIDFQSLVVSFLEKYSYLYNLSAREKRVLTDKYLNFMAPSTATLETIKKFQKEYENLKIEYSNILDFDVEKKNNNRTLVSLMAKDHMTKRISYNIEFDQLVIPSQNDLGFGYFESKKADMLKTFTKRDIIQRGNEEANKNFANSPALKSKDLNPKVSGRLNDLVSLKTTFFAPVFMKERAKNIKFGLDSSIPHKQINKALRVKDMQSSSKRRKINNFTTRKPKTPTQIEENGEQFVVSSDSLGANSEFVRYDEAFDSYNIIEKETEASTKIINLNSGFQNNRQFEDVLDATKNLTEIEAAKLPNQLKAVISGQTQYSRTNYLSQTGDLLAGPTTKNYYEINNFSVKKLMFIDGFMRDKNNNILLNKPVYKEMTTQNLESLDKPVICKLDSYTNKRFKIEDNDIAAVDSVFVLSDSDITVKPSTQTNQVEPNYNIQNVSYEFMNSQIVVQTNNKILVQLS